MNNQEVFERVSFAVTEVVESKLDRDKDLSSLETFRHDGKLLVKHIAAVADEQMERNGVSLTVPEGCYYVLDDNVENSYDSRYWENPFV